MFGTDERTCLFLSPDRAGMTWFFAGTAYCLEAAMNDSGKNQITDTQLNQPLKQLSYVFKHRDFDNQLLDPNDPNEFEFLKFQLNQQGLIRQYQTTVKTVDYAGEHLSNIETEPGSAYESFSEKWDFETLPTFEECVKLNQSGDIHADQIPSLISVLAHEADLLGLVLPMDDFTEKLTDDELPAHLEQSSLEDRRTFRRVPRLNETYEGYLQLYADMCKKNDFFFLATMSDVFLRTYRESESELSSPLTSWESFREHVWGHIQDIHTREHFEPGLHIDMDSHQHLFPVYFEPDPKEPRTAHGEMNPKLDWNDDHYSLRGLQYVRERIGQ